MERDNRKRGRSEDDENKDQLVKNAKKLDLISCTSDDLDDIHTSKEQDTYSDPMVSTFDTQQTVGVFDFPWLKEDEDAMFKAEELMSFGLFEDAFAPCKRMKSCVDDASEETCFSSITTDDKLDNQNYLLEQIKDQSPRGHQGFQDGDDKLYKNDEGESRIDSIWSSVLDQPLDIGLNKLI